MGLRRIDGFCGEDQLQGFAPANDASQALAAAAHGYQAPGGLGQGEAGLGAGQTNVAGQGQLQAGADGIAVDGADDRSRELGQAVEGMAQGLRAASGLPFSGQQGRVPAQGKDRGIAPAEDGHPHLGVVVYLGAGSRQLLQQLAVDTVPLLGTPQVEVGDSVALREPDGLIGHRRFQREVW